MRGRLLQDLVRSPGLTQLLRQRLVLGLELPDPPDIESSETIAGIGAADPGPSRLDAVPSCSATRCTVPCSAPSSLRNRRTSRTASAFSPSLYRRVVGLPGDFSFGMTPSSIPRYGASGDPRAVQNHRVLVSAIRLAIYRTGDGPPRPRVPDTRTVVTCDDVTAPHQTNVCRDYDLNDGRRPTGRRRDRDHRSGSRSSLQVFERIRTSTDLT